MRTFIRIWLDYIVASFLCGETDLLGVLVVVLLRVSRTGEPHREKSGAVRASVDNRQPETSDSDMSSPRYTALLLTLASISGMNYIVSISTHYSVTTDTKYYFQSNKA